VREVLVGAATTPTVVIKSGRGDRQQATAEHSMGRARCTATTVPATKEEDVVHASIIDMTLRLPVDEVLFDELRTDFLPKAAQHPGFRGFQYVLAEQGRAVGILWYERPEDLDGITQLVGSWFQDHIAPRLAGPETAMRGRVVVNMTPRTTRT
jgi:hypothetical protein